MSKRKNSNIVGIVIAIALLALIIGVIAFLTNGFKSGIKTFTVNIDGRTFMNDTDNVTLSSESEIIVTNLFADDYAVSVHANATDTNDFIFYVGNEKYTWADDATGNDFTDCFLIAKTDNGFTIAYDGIAGILSSKFPNYNIFVATAPEDKNNLFTLIVTSGTSSITLGFTLSEFVLSEGEIPDEGGGSGGGVTNIKLDVDRIVF